MSGNDLQTRAWIAWLGRTGVMSQDVPLPALTTVEQHNGREYVVLRRSESEVAAVYRHLAHRDELKLLRRWPDGIV